MLYKHKCSPCSVLRLLYVMTLKRSAWEVLCRRRSSVLQLPNFLPLCIPVQKGRAGRKTPSHLLLQFKIVVYLLNPFFFVNGVDLVFARSTCKHSVLLRGWPVQDHTQGNQTTVNSNIELKCILTTRFNSCIKFKFAIMVFRELPSLGRVMLLN